MSYLKNKIAQKQITYTEEMKEQDKLWESEEEDLDTMKKLMNDIIEEAKSLGFKQYAYIYSGPNETICDIYENEEAYNDGKDALEIFGFCKPLVDYINYELNK